MVWVTMMSQELRGTIDAITGIYLPNSVYKLLG